MKRLLALCIICILTVAIAYAQDEQREEMMRDYERMMKRSQVILRFTEVLSASGAAGQKI